VVQCGDGPKVVGREDVGVGREDVGVGRERARGHHAAEYRGGLRVVVRWW
jgi:hypothetical protein